MDGGRRSRVGKYEIDMDGRGRGMARNVRDITEGREGAGPGMSVECMDGRGWMEGRVRTR